MKRRYTIVMHNYIGYGSYIVEFRRICCKPSDLTKVMQDLRHGDPHFYIPGWPEILWPTGMSYWAKAANA